MSRKLFKIEFLACGLNQVRCDNGLCVDKHLVCDGNDDCGDRSDEESNCSECFVCCPNLKNNQLQIFFLRLVC